MKRRMLDLFCGRFGWGKAFATRGWEVVGVDLVRPDEIPEGCKFFQVDARSVFFRDGGFYICDIFGEQHWLSSFDFGCASSPCENFSLFGMAMFHPNPPYPEMGVELFNHARAMFERAKIPYVMENVRSAQLFVGAAAAHCGPFYLWGSGIPADVQAGIFGDETRVPRTLPKGIVKGMKLGGSTKFGQMSIEERRKHRTQDLMLMAGHGSKKRKEWTSKVATIPPKLASCVADYAERLLELREQSEAAKTGK